MTKANMPNTWVAVSKLGTYFKYDKYGNLVFSPMLTDGSRGSEVGEVDSAFLRESKKALAEEIAKLDK